MATDYDAPRRGAEENNMEPEAQEEGLRASEKNEPQVSDTDDGEIVEPYEVPMADLSGEELSGEVVPRQSDEFTCSYCFMVQHRSRIAEQQDGEIICRDCA